MREGWELKEIGEFAKVVGGGTPSTKIEEYWNGDIPWITPNDLSNYNFKFILRGERNITERGLLKSSTKLHPKNTILLTSRAPIGYLAIAGQSLTTNQGFQSIICNENLANPSYIFYCLKVYIDKIKAVASGATFPEVSGKKVSKVKIPLPPLETQRKIAKILSNYDDLIENNLKRIKILEEMAQQTYEEWFVRMRFPGYETTKINETTGLPEGWERDLVGNQLDKIKSTTKIKSSEIQKSGLFPVIDQSRDFIAGFTDDRVAVLRYSNTPYIVFGDHTRVLKLINFDFARGADGTQIIKSKNKRMPQHLFYFTLMNIDLSNYHYARHFKYLKDSEIIIPSESIANTFEDLVKLNYDIIFNLQSQNQRLREARDILLPRLMMGLVDVDDIDL